MKRLLFFCIFLLVGLYALQFWLERRTEQGEELELTVREGAQVLQERLGSPQFQDKVREILEKRTPLQDEFVAQWSLLKRAAEQGIARLGESDSESLRKIAQAVSDVAAAEGERVQVEVAQGSALPAHWMVAGVTNLILIAWVVFGITVLWLLARYFARDRS